MSYRSSIVIIFLIAFQLFILSGCLNIKDSEGNKIYIDTNETTVTSPDGKELYKKDERTKTEVFYDKDIDRYKVIHNNSKDQ